MATIEDILRRYDEFVENALSTEPQATAVADAAYRDLWGLLTPEERQFLSMSRIDCRDMGVDPEDFHGTASEVRGNLMARLLS